MVSMSHAMAYVVYTATSSGVRLSVAQFDSMARLVHSDHLPSAAFHPERPPADVVSDATSSYIPYVEVHVHRGSTPATLVSKRTCGLPVRIVGMTNVGNTCFLNSVLQCLRFTPGLTLALEKARQRLATGGVPRASTQSTELLKSYVEMTGSDALPMNPRAVKDALGLINKRYTEFNQQDAFEVGMLLFRCVCAGSDVRWWAFAGALRVDKWATRSREHGGPL